MNLENREYRFMAGFEKGSSVTSLRFLKSESFSRSWLNLTEYASSEAFSENEVIFDL